MPNPVADDFNPYVAPKAVEPAKPFFERPSLAEILVVVVILGVLIGLLVPAVSVAKRAGRRPAGGKNWTGDAVQSGHPDPTELRSGPPWTNGR